MTFTRSPRMIARYLDGRLSGMGPVNRTPTRLRLVGSPPLVHVLKSGRRFRVPFTITAMVVESR